MSFRSVRQAVLKKVRKCTRDYLLQLKDTLPNMKFTRKISRYYHPSHYIDPHVDFNFTTAYQSQTNGGGVGVSSFAMTTNKPPPPLLPIHINTHTYFHTYFQTRDRLVEGGRVEGGRGLPDSQDTVNSAW